MHTGITNLKLILLSDLFFKIFSMASQFIFLEFLSSIHIRGRYLPARTLDVAFLTCKAKGTKLVTFRKIYLRPMWRSKTLFIKFHVTMTIAF